jgi:SH3-like domain-containing protein
VVTTLARGARVKLEGYGVYTDIDGETAKWARITTPDGKTGWVFSGYLADAPK